MLKNLISDVKLATMDIVGEVKDTVHEMTTKLPEQVQTDYSNMDKQSMDNTNLMYMSNGWNNVQAGLTANKIDMIADKMKFVSSMIQTGLLGFDAIEEELRIMSMQLTPPRPEQLTSLAIRIDSTQRQVYEGLQELKRLTESIDKATDTLQVNGASSGWTQPTVNNAWK